MVDTNLEQAIPVGFCQCGCGEKTKLNETNDQSRGMVKGQPRRFLAGHHLAIKTGVRHERWKGGKFTDTDGYMLIQDPNQLKRNGYKCEHILVAEKALGKSLPVNAVVHHVDGCKSNNSNDNLVICQDHAYHMLLHARIEALRECGHADWRRCRFCKQYDSPDNMYYNKASRAFHHRSCHAANERKRRANK